LTKNAYRKKYWAVRTLGKVLPPKAARGFGEGRAKKGFGKEKSEAEEQNLSE